MRYRQLGPSGIQASVIAAGTWAIGGWMWGGTDEANSIAAIHAALDAGINFVDTAPAYGLGLSEEIVGKALRGRRDKVVLATKCGLVWHVQKGTLFFEQAGRPVYRYLGADSVRYEVEQSLRRLGTDYIDLLQTHWQDATTPIAETMGALLDLKREGKIRAIGVSNATVTDIEQYRRLGPVDSDQEKFNLLDRQAEAELLPYVRKNGIAFLAYSPLALGLLTGRISPDRRFPPDDQRNNNPRFTPQSVRRVNAVLEELEPLARQHGCDITQLVLAWTLAVPGVTHALVGARNAAQASANAVAGNIELQPEAVARIADAFAAHAPA